MDNTGFEIIARPGRRPHSWLSLWSAIEAAEPGSAVRVPRLPLLIDEMNRDSSLRVRARKIGKRLRTKRSSEGIAFWLEDKP